jgi:hypothetical protein
VIHATSAEDAFAICSNQTHVLCGAASAFVSDDVGHAKCVIKTGNSISTTPGQQTSATWLPSPANCPIALPGMLTYHPFGYRGRPLLEEAARRGWDG